jgi:uncharacterized protein YdhG (YjbR/CyaY superfamily)
MKDYKNLDRYVTQFPIEIQKILNELRNIIKKIAPNNVAEYKYFSKIRYELNGKFLFYLAVRKYHIGFYVFPSVINAFNNELSEFKLTKAVIQIPYNIQLPINLFEKIVKFRIEEVLKK